MILADKIIEERKKLNLSQEELADKLNVSRQAVSKWESAQSIPDLQKIVMMSELFSCSTDYLLKDDIENTQNNNTESKLDQTIKKVTLEEANDYLENMKKQSKMVSLGVLLCILSPVTLIFLSGLSTKKIYGITENIAAAIGLFVIFILVAIAVFIFIRNGLNGERFDYLEHDIFETGYGVSGLVKQKKIEYNKTYIAGLSIGIVLCVLSPLPLIITALFNEDELLIISLLSLLLCIVSIGVYLIVRVSIIKASFDVLLQDGDYNKENKISEKSSKKVGSIYWPLITSIYLLWSFTTNDWKITWVIWPIAGVLFVPITLIVKSINKEN